MEFEPVVLWIEKQVLPRAMAISHDNEWLGKQGTWKINIQHLFEAPQAYIVGLNIVVDLCPTANGNGVLVFFAACHGNIVIIVTYLDLQADLIHLKLSYFELKRFACLKNFGG